MEECINRLAYIIDDDGYVVRTTTVYSSEEYVDGNIVAISPNFSSSFWKKRWTGVEWIEGESQTEREERESNELIESMKPSQEDLKSADLEIKMITLLMEMEVI